MLTALRTIAVATVAAGIVLVAGAALTESKAASKASPCATCFAVVNPDGTLARGKGVVHAGKSGPGVYTIRFTSPVDRCVWNANLGLKGPTRFPVLPGEVSVVGEARNLTGIDVHTYDSAGTPADRGFDLRIGC